MKEFVLAEKAQLDARLAGLIPYLKTEESRNLPIAEQRRLYRQCEAMKEYSSTLGERLAAEFE